MDKRTKLILSVVGACAIIIPALLLIFLTPKTQEQPQVSSESRTLDQNTIEEVVKNASPKQPEFPSPSPATSSARPTRPVEGSPSAQ